MFCAIVATHGTGIKFGNLATFVTSFEMVTGTGEVSSLVDMTVGRKQLHSLP